MVGFRRSSSAGAVLTALLLVAAACSSSTVERTQPLTSTSTSTAIGPEAPGLPDVEQQPTGGGATVIEVASSEFAFSLAELRFQPGQTVTLRLRNDGEGLHNIEIPELGAFVEAARGQTAETTFTVPDAAGSSAAFFCNVPGHRQLGMEGAVVISSG